MAKVHEVHAKDRFRAIWKFTKFTPMALLVAGCGDVSGQREPPPPAIAAGEYMAIIDPNSGYSRHSISYWMVDLSQGGLTQKALVQRCELRCVSFELPVRAGLNGLSITFPAADGKPAYDLAISAEPTGLRLSHDTPQGFWQADLVAGVPVHPPPVP